LVWIEEKSLVRGWSRICWFGQRRRVWLEVGVGFVGLDRGEEFG